jgi:hypothetical protein
MTSDETCEDGEQYGDRPEGYDVNPDSEPAYDLGQVFISADAIQWQVVRRWLDIDEDDPNKQYVYDLQNCKSWKLSLNEDDLLVTLTPFSEDS